MTDAPEHVLIEIGAGESGSRIDRFLGNRFYPAYSRSFLTGLIADGRIRVNGHQVRPAYRLGPGDRIDVELVENSESSPAAENIPLDVLYEDDFLLLVNKPAGMIVHPGPNTKSGTLVNALLFRNPEIGKVGVVFRPGIVHRLDGFTSGVMVVAKTNHARVHLVEQFKAKQVRKEYRAVVVGEMPFDSDYIDLPIGEDESSKDRMKVDPENGKPSSTFYQVVERFPVATHVAAFPHTGRTHQIRVHLAHIGFPVVADPAYGKRYAQKWASFVEQQKAAGTALPEVKRHLLHAHKLRLLHPVTNEEMEFTSPIPADMSAVLEFLRGMKARA